ncbi:MAG: argininosuccinate synthase [Bdellovibrionales bacterium]|nr:argininosuccinate synthase [Bdellovibrionales bacterium]
MKRVVLAYSGGLDTSFCVKYLQEQGYEVLTLTVDTGGFPPEELKKIESLAVELGSSEHRTLDSVDEVFDRFGSYLIKGNILRGGVYPLVVGAERVIQAEKVAEMAKEVGATAVAHGSTGAGNDQVRFDVAIATLAPHLEVITPIRSLQLSREQEINFLKEKGVDLPVARKTYSINQGIFGVTIGGGETHDSWAEVPNEPYIMTVSLADAPREAEEVVLRFERGLPVALNGQELSGRQVLDRLNTVGGKHGFGRGIHTGDTILGIKGRIAFEAPGMLSIIKAHQELEKLVLTKNQLEWKQTIGQFYGSYLHEAKWYDPVMRDWEAFLNSTQVRVSGEVKVRFHLGHCEILGARSEYSLLAVGSKYGEESALWTGAEAQGYSKIYGVGPALAYRVKR